MNIITRIKNAIGLEQRAALGLNGWPVVPSYGAVTPEGAQGLSSVFGAVALISEALGALPLKLYRDDRVVASDHPLHAVLHRAPNPHQSPQEFIEWMSACMLLHGNAYARVTRRWDGQVSALHPLVPERVTVLRNGDAIAGFEYTDAKGVRERLLPDEVFHLRHRAGNDPLIGQSPIQACRAALEVALSEQEHGRSTFNNGAKLLGVLKFPGALKPEQRAAIASSWASQYAGGSNSGRTAILENGVSYEALSMSMADAQWLESRQFGVQEVARIFKVPPPLLADLGSANYSNTVHLNRVFVSHCLGRHMSAWEGAISRQLLTEAGRRTYHPEFSAEGLLRGDSTTRAAFYSSAINDGWMLASEARRMENLPPIAGIDEARPTGKATPAAQPYPSKEAL